MLVDASTYARLFPFPLWIGRPWSIDVASLEYPSFSSKVSWLGRWSLPNYSMASVQTDRDVVR